MTAPGSGPPRRSGRKTVPKRNHSHGGRAGRHSPVAAHTPGPQKRSRRRPTALHTDIVQPSPAGTGTWREHVDAHVLADAERRTRRCETALRSALLPFSAECAEDHIITATGSQEARPSLPPGCALHQVTRRRFNSTDNSKRFVSNFLFWKLACGIQFPVTDSLLKTSWKCISSCDYGIKYA